ncbi:hypothetical protein QDW68_25075 (plasmid) [Escherichia coli]|nr:hypothetical protein QDW68_25075 [Escherichia coli]
MTLAAITMTAPERGHNTHAVTLDKTGHNSTPSLTEATGRAALWLPVPRCLWAVHRVR